MSDPLGPPPTDPIEWRTTHLDPNRVECTMIDGTKLYVDTSKVLTASKLDGSKLTVEAIKAETQLKSEPLPVQLEFDV